MEGLKNDDVVRFLWRNGYARSDKRVLDPSLGLFLAQGNLIFHLTFFVITFHVEQQEPFKWVDSKVKGQPGEYFDVCVTTNFETVQLKSHL